MSDLYADLGVGKQASPEDVKVAFRKKAKKVHPDAGGDRESFERLRKAYDVLSDPVRRLTYDKTGSTEEEHVDQVRRAALSMISTMIEKYLNDQNLNFDLPMDDLVEHMRGQMRAQLAAINMAIDGYKNMAVRVKQMAKRFKVKRGKPNVLKSMFDARHADLVRAAERGEGPKAETEEAIKILETIEFLDYMPSDSGSGYAFSQFNSGPTSASSQQQVFFRLR